MWLLHSFGAHVIRSVECLSNQNLISQDKQFKHSSELLKYFTQWSTAIRQTHNLVSHNETFRYRSYRPEFHTNILMIKRFQDQGEHLLSFIVHPVSTFSNNNPTFTSKGSINTKNILSCKNETAGIQSNMKV